jgi:hypothetical protein
MLIKDGKWVSEELPGEIRRKFEHAGIKDPFCCEKWQIFVREGK